MADMNIHIVEGEAFYAMILGKPRQNYNKDGFEWTIDVRLDDAQVKHLKGLGLGKKIKNKGDERGNFISFKRNAEKRNGPEKGEKNDPIRVVGPDGKTPWDSAIKIGNGSKIKVKFVLNETKNARTGEKGMRADPLAIQVGVLVPYEAKERQEFDAMDEDQLLATAATAANKDW